MQSPQANPSAIGVGVDFGTSNSTIAWFDGRELHLVSLEGDGPILPSAIHLNREFAPLTGAAAVTQYVEENRGRLVQLVAEEIGEEGMALGELGRPGGRGDSAGLRRVVYGPLVDRGQMGRLFQELKRLLGDPAQSVSWCSSVPIDWWRYHSDSRADATGTRAAHRATGESRACGPAGQLRRAR